MTSETSKSNELWRPSPERISSSEMARFQAFLKKDQGVSFSDYPELHRYSVENPKKFWDGLSRFYEINFSTPASDICADLSFESYSWFSEARLNFAQNLLEKGSDNDCALHFIHESNCEEKISYGQLRSRVGQLSQALKTTMKEGNASYWG